MIDRHLLGNLILLLNIDLIVHLLELEVQSPTSVQLLFNLVKKIPLALGENKNLDDSLEKVTHDKM